MIKERLLHVIACPKCLAQLHYDEAKQKLICQQDQLVYSVTDGITVLLENEAKPVTEFYSKENV